MEFTVVQHAQSGHSLAQMECRIERLDLFQQPIDQLLGAADGQCRNVINRLVGIEFGALSAGKAQRVDDVRADAKQAQFEDLKEAHGTGADDHRFDVLFRHVKRHSSSESGPRIVAESLTPIPSNQIRSGRYIYNERGPSNLSWFLREQARLEALAALATLKSSLVGVCHCLASKYGPA